MLAIGVSDSSVLIAIVGSSHYSRALLNFVHAVNKTSRVVTRSHVLSIFYLKPILIQYRDRQVQSFKLRPNNSLIANHYDDHVVGVN